MRVHYIFHTGFCCSTLLARYLELLPHVLVLKEPGLLSRLAVALVDADHVDDVWRDVATVTLALLTRTYAPDQAIAVKASDWSNGIAGFALASDPSATATCQMVSLRRFALAVLKSPGRRRWAHARARLAEREAERMGRLGQVASAGLTDGQAAAFIWLANARLFRRLIGGVDAGRVALIDGDELAARPGPCLGRVLTTSALGARGTDVGSLVDSAASRAYSKEQRQPFDAAARAAELRRLSERWGSEADEAVSWAMDIDPATSTMFIDPSPE